MNDPLDELESELLRLRPASLPAEVTARIDAQLARPLRRDLGDRCLMTFIGSGAVAATVVVCLIGWEMIENAHPAGGSPPTPPAAVAAAQPAPPSIATYQQALARSDGLTLELLR